MFFTNVRDMSACPRKFHAAISAVFTSRFSIDANNGAASKVLEIFQTKCPRLSQHVRASHNLFDFCRKSFKPKIDAHPAKTSVIPAYPRIFWGFPNLSNHVSPVSFSPIKTAGHKKAAHTRQSSWPVFEYVPA